MIEMQNLTKRFGDFTAVDRLNMTIVPTTHYMEEAQALCGRVALIHRGKFQKLDSPDALIDELGAYAVDETGESGRKSRYFHHREDAIAYLAQAGQQASFRAVTPEELTAYFEAVTAPGD